MEMEYRYDCCESPSILYIYSRLGRREDGRTGSRSSEKRRIYDKMDLGVRGGGWRRRRPGRWRWSARQSVTPGAIWPIRDRPQKWASFVPILRVEDEKWDTALRLSQKKETNTEDSLFYVSFQPEKRWPAHKLKNCHKRSMSFLMAQWAGTERTHGVCLFFFDVWRHYGFTTTSFGENIYNFCFVFVFFSRLHYQLKITPNQTTR